MNQKELDKEGLTKEFLRQFSLNKIDNTAQLFPNEEPVKLVKCSQGYWISLDSKILKDENNKYIVISEKEAIIGCARYFLNFKNEIYAEKLNNEINRLKRLVDDELIRVSKNIRRGLIFAGVIKPSTEGFEWLSYKLEKGEFDATPNSIIKDVFNKNVEKAKELVDEKTKNIYDYLVSQIELENNKDYDFLYSYLFQDSTFQIATFDEKSIDTMVKFFHIDKLSDTINEIKQHSHIENIAKFNIEKSIDLHLKNK